MITRTAEGGGLALPGTARPLLPRARRFQHLPPCCTSRRGFDYSGGAWATLMGQPGPYLLYSDGAGVRLTATLVAGGAGGKSLLIQAVQITRGGLAATTSVSKVGALWQTTGEPPAPPLLPPHLLRYCVLRLQY